MTINLVNQGSEVVEDALWWLVVPAENLIVKEPVNLEPGAAFTKAYTFTVTNPGLHLAQAYLSLFTTVVAEAQTTFIAGEGSQKGAQLTLDYQPEYLPGEINVVITVQNLGRDSLAPALLYNEAQVELPTLAPGEGATHTLTLSYPEPGAYAFALAVQEKGAAPDLPPLDAEQVVFRIKPLDTLTVQSSTDKPIYKVGEEVHTTVRVINTAGEEVRPPYTLEIKMPSGQLSNQLVIEAQEPGTYVMRVMPDAPGYSVLPGKTFFIVERQSDLVLRSVTVPEGLEVTVTTEAGGPVEGARVVLAGQSQLTDTTGKATFTPPTALAFVFQAEKTGFNPAQEAITRVVGDVDGNGVVNLADLLAVAHGYGTRRGTEQWDRRLDLVPDGVIDVYERPGNGCQKPDFTGRPRVIAAKLKLKPCAAIVLAVHAAIDLDWSFNQFILLNIPLHETGHCSMATYQKETII